MAEMNCKGEDKYKLEDGRCCDRCPAGKYKLEDCNSTTQTVCVACPEGSFLATKNHIPKCNLCKTCHHTEKQLLLSKCTATHNTVCQCQTGFYCNNESCDHCSPVTLCPLGQGVRSQATRTNDTVCAPCEKGTYSNVTDLISPCKAHTRCDEYGKTVKTLGTATSDTVCGDFKYNRCSWMLPAGLWAGLVCTILLLFVFLIWRSKRKSFRTVKRESSGPVDKVPSPPATPPEHHCHCQETCTIDFCNIPLNQDDTPINLYLQDTSLDSSLPISKLKSSVSFVEFDNTNGVTKHCSTNLLRSYSEPQEDEWCGT